MLRPGYSILDSTNRSYISRYPDYCVYLSECFDYYTTKDPI